MNRALSLYLDLLRFSAAMMVFLGHIAGARFTGGLFWQLINFKAEAVTLFFVMSGFVIAHVTATRESNAADYAIARAARIASVALPALLLTFALDQIGLQIRPELYSAAWGYVATDQVGQFLAGLTFTNQLWFRSIPVGSDLPYWSLGFEVWYYGLFGVLVFARGWRRWIGAALVLAVIGPKIAVLFPVWLMGLAAYHLCTRHRLNQKLGLVLFGADVALWVAYETARADGTLPNFFPFQASLDLVTSYAVALLFCGHLVAVAACAEWLENWLNHFARPIRWLAGMTFSLYLVHLPLAQLLATLNPWPPESWLGRIGIIATTFLSVAVFAEVSERRKGPWRRMFAGLIHRTVPQSARIP